MNGAGRTDRYRPSRRGKRFRSVTPEHWLTKRSGREGKIHADGHVLCRRSPAGRGMPFPAPGVMRDGRFGPFGHTCRRGASVTGEDIQGPGRSCTPCCRRRFESVPGRRMTATPCDESQGVFFLRLKTPRYAGSSKKAKPLHKLKKGFLCEITSCLDSKSIHKGTQ